ncbi:golgin subfamily B member 1-like isoform X3 [Rhineura floridana]|uniref:golgin subfamily B member 1-like isoform X3 n=1 Tax=Rhineura floridana TaxID=261503 RepID=UPI002AC887DC|nr:golgin subfamily B member 1-like isoform X3 [Rhineura floridana]
MWKWGSGDDSAPKSGAHGTSQTASMSVTDLTEQLVQTEQLVAQLKELVKEKDNELRHKEQQLKEEKEASEAKISKLKLQNKAKVTSLTSQLEEFKKQVSGARTQEGKPEQKKGYRDSDQENAAASRGKILVLKKKLEELEIQNAQRNEELQKKIAELDAAHQRGTEMDAMLAEKQKKLAEKEAYIIDLQLSCGSTNDAREVLIHNTELKNQLSTKEASLQSMQLLVQNLTKKVGDSEERCSVLQEQIENLKSIQSKEKEHFQEREAMYTQNICMFQNIIQEKEKELMGLAQKHEQELFKLAAKSDASADLEQLLKALKQKLHEKEEVMLGRTQVIVMLQQELDGKDEQLKEVNEHLNRLQSEKDNLQSKLDAEKHVMRAQLRDMLEKQEIEMKKVREKHNADTKKIQEKHETELQEKHQALLQLQQQMEKLSSSDQSKLEQVVDIDAAIKQKLEHLEAQAKLKTEEASKSEAKFLKIKAWSKSRIRQLEDELKNAASVNNNVTALHDRISELEKEKEDLQSTLQAFSELKAQNEELLGKLEVYEEQQRKLQADLEQVTKRAASQASESGSVDELQSQLLEWQEIVTESEDAHSQIREEKSAMALRMAQIEEEREAIVSGQQELEEELATVQGIGRMQPDRRKAAQSSRKLQEDYGFDGKQCYEELNVTLDSTDSAEGENMGGWWPEYSSPHTGLRTVVEELELERNQLQEQILFLEERCRDLEDRLQLQNRVEALQVAFGAEEEGQLLRAVQNENDRLQIQLTQLRSQQARDTEKHQVLVSNLNEQLKGLNERNGLLETLLGEKEQKLSSIAEKLERIEDMRNSLQERDLLNKELSEKLLQSEQKLEDALKKCNTYGAECAEQKTIINDLTEKMAAFKEKTVKQDAAMELMRLDLEQTNEELDRLNTSHLEERSQLIQDLQRREREIDNLREILAEKDKEISSLSSNMTEYSEQINILKRQIKCKEDEIREMEEALSKAEREAQLLKDIQTADVKDASTKFSELSEQLSAIESELAKVKAENESKTKENEELVRQIKETSQTIKHLNCEIKTRDVTYNNKLMEYESQIKLLKEQIIKSTEKLQETEIKCREETDHLKSQLDEHISAKEKLNTLLKERENKEQSFENELKSVKDLHNQLILENAQKDGDLANLSTQVAKHTEHLEIAKKSLQEKAEIIISLKDKLKVLEQQSVKEKLKLVGELDIKKTQWKEVKNELHEKCEIINKMETESQTNILTNKQLQAALEQKEKDFAGQLKANEDLRNEVRTMEKEKQQLISENESLSKLLDVKECELLKRAQSMAEMESKMCANATENQKMLSEVSRDKETLRSKVEELSDLVKQKENSVAERLLEKEKECGILADELSKSREATKQFHEEVQSFGTQLKDAKNKELEKEAMLSQKVLEYNKMVQQLSQGEEKLLSLQKQVEDLEKKLKIKSKSIEEGKRHNDALFKQVEEKQVNMITLEREIERLKGDNILLSHQVEEKDSVLLSQGLELEDLRRQIAKKTAECAALNDQLALLVKEVDVLKYEKDSALAICTKRSNECDAFQHQLTRLQCEIVSTKHEAHMLKLENEKLKADIETVTATLMKNCEGIVPLNAQFSQQSHNILAFMDQTDTLVSEIKTLKSSFHEKEALLSQREALIQQMKENKDAGDKQHLQMISDLQSQIQVLNCEASQLRQEVQQKENKLRKQDQELKLLKDKSEESDLLRVQLSENMQTISDLQCQFKNMIENTEVLSKTITEKDTFLKQKEQECVNLQACISETSCMQQKHLESITTEAERLKAIVLEKELLINNISLLNNKLKAELQEKESECETLKKQVTDVEELNLSLKKEISDQNKLINDISQTLAEKEGSLLDNANLVKTLGEELKINEEKSRMVSELHDQMNGLNQEIQKLQELAQEKEKAFLALQDKFAAQYEQRSELSASLSKKKEFIAGLLNSLDQKDISVQLAESNVRALTNEIELLREELEKSAAIRKKLLQEKDESIAISQKKTDSLTVELESVKSEHQKALEQVDLWKQNVQHREGALQVAQEKCTEQAKHIEYLNSEFSAVNLKSSQECHSHTLSIEKLQQQVDSLIKDKIILQEKYDKLSVENIELVKYQNQLQQQSKELQELHEKLEASENESRMHQRAVTLQLENEREQLQMQVSVKGEEAGELKVKVEKLEQSLLLSENRWVTELASATQQNEINLEQLSSLEREIKSKDAQIQSLQQEQDIIKKELSKHLSALSSRYFIKDSDSDAAQQVTESKIVLEKFSTLIDRILSKEVELQQTILQREKDVHHLNNQLESVLSLREEKELMQNDFKKVKDANQPEIEYLLNELSSAKDTLRRQQSVCEERDTALTKTKKQVAFLQEKINKLEKELKSSYKTLNIKYQEAAKLLEELEHKNQMIENLNSQTKQQKDLITSLSQQLKEKDYSVTQVMESMSNEMVKFSEEKNVLATQVQQLEAIRNSMNEEANILSQQVEECKKELELNQIVLTDKEATIKDLVSEKAQLNIALEKLNQEKENLNKKLQAALLLRKDLIRKLEKLEKHGQEDSRREFKKTQDLLEQIDELAKQVKNADAHNKDLVSQLEGLKKQLLVKDAKINEMSKMLSAKATHLDQLQKDVTEFKATIAEQKSMSDKKLIEIQEKDCLLAQMQSVHSEKERMYGEEFSQLFLTIENLKSEISKRDDTFKEMNGSESTLKIEGSCSDSTHQPDEINPVTQLEKDKEILQKKLKALLVARKESTKTIQKQKEEHAKLLAEFDELTKDFELMKDEHKVLQEIHQRKCKEFDSNVLLLCSLQTKLEAHTSLHHNENAKQKTFESEELNTKTDIRIQESEKNVSAIAMEETKMMKFHSNYARFMEEGKKVKEELKKKSVELDGKEQEAVKLKVSVEQLEQQYKQDKENMLTERIRLQQQLETYKNEVIAVKTMIETVNNEKDQLHKKSEEDHLISLEEIEHLKLDVQQANMQISGKDEEIKYLHNSLKDLKGKFDHGKEIMKEVTQLQQSLQESQEETKHFKTVLEKVREEREEFISNLEKSNMELLNMKEELRHASEENKQLLMELNMLREKVLPVVLCVEGRREDTKTMLLQSDTMLENRVESTEQSSSLQDVTCRERESLDVTNTERVTLIKRAGDQYQQPTEMPREQMGGNVNGGSFQPQLQKYDAEEKIRERLQRKLQAALISRKEALKENKILKDQMELLILENKELIDKVHTLDHLMSEMSREKQDLNTALYKEETLVAENARLLIENENLTAACESLKSTMETIGQEKEAFSFQLNSLKDSQTVELTGWKAKHSELKQEYESLLQAYDNISSKIAEMRQTIDVTKKEKQEALHKINERESDKQELKELLQKATDENAEVKEQLKHLVESKQKEISELKIEEEKQASELKLCLEKYQKNIDEYVLQNKQLTEENEQLKEASAILKRTLEKAQKENKELDKDFSLAKSALGDLQTQLQLDNNAQSKISDSLSERESLLKHIHFLNEGILGKEKRMLILEQENNIILERLKDAEECLYQKKSSLSMLENDCKILNREIISLGERIKILEDDKCLLQEELENVQETSYKVKNEREFLETELLNHIKKLDQTTERLKATQVQNSLLAQQLEDLKAEKYSTIREKEEQQLHLVRVFEEKVKTAQRDNNGAKNKTKELQELLKEKQQEINQLQKDSIKYQEMILDLEKSVKLSRLKSEKIEKDLNNAEEKLTKSNEELQKLTEKLCLWKSLLDESKAEIEQLAKENLNSKKELKKKENQIFNQKKEYESQLEFSLQQLKATCQREWLNLEEKYNSLQREKETILGDNHLLQEEIGIRDIQNKNLQTELNDTLARLAAFAKCMSSLQNDRDRVIGEMKTWETQFKEVIENKQQQIEASNVTIASLQKEIKIKMVQVQELELKSSMLEEPQHAMQVCVDSHNFNELSRIKAENVILQDRQHELATALQSKEDSLQALLKEKKSFNHLIKNNNTIEKDMEALRNNLTTKEWEMQQLLLGKSEIKAELEKQVAISDQMKIMLNRKDMEILLLISSKDPEVSEYLTQIQTQHREQVAECDQQIKSLQAAKDKSDETCLRMKNEFRNLQMKADKAVQDRAEIASEIDAFKKALSSLQNDRDSLLSKHKNLEHEHRVILCEKERLVADSANENRSLKKELRKLLNQIDDLHSENAMLTAQLIKYREDLNQVLSLKDNQLKELLTQKLESIKNLEQEKLELQKKLKELQLTMKVQDESIGTLQQENKKLMSKTHDLEILIASINKKRLASESREKSPGHNGDSLDQKKGLAVSHHFEENVEKRLQEFQHVVGKHTKDTEERYHESISALEHDAKLLENEAIELPHKRLLEIQIQNKELRSQIESFGKAMTALQDDRERLIEDFKVLQSKYTSELRYEKSRADKLETVFSDFKSNVLCLLKENALLNQASLENESKFTLDQLTDELENLCKLLNTRNLEISRLSTECENYAQQMDAFSKAMACLQDDRDRLRQELCKLRVMHEAKQGTSLISVPSDYISEISYLKHNLESLQMDRDRMVKEGANLATAQVAKLKAKVDELERDLHQTKAFQEEAEKERASYQTELVELRMEKNVLLAESQALQNQFQATLSEKEQQIAELQRLHREMVSQGSISAGSKYPTKGLEAVALVGSTDVPDQVNHLLAERIRLQDELQRCLQELHQRELRFQQTNSKVMQAVEENTVLTAQLKNMSQTLRDNQLRYSDLQNRYLRLEREYQVQVTSVQGTTQGEAQAEVPPGAPQERAGVIVEIDNMELDELRKRLAEMELQHDSTQQTVSQLMETLSEERNRRQAAEEALGLSEEQIKRLEMSSYRSTLREYTVQVESDEEREALIINANEHMIVRKVKGGALSFRRWIRGRSLYCSKLLTSRAKSRYLFLSYLVILHLLVFLCLTGIL